MTTILDRLLEKHGVDYDSLTREELATLTTWVNAIQEKQLTIEKIKGFILSLRSTVEQELTKYDLSDKQDLFLKARLKNLMLIEAFLSTPEYAKAQLEMAISNISSKEVG